MIRIDEYEILPQPVSVMARTFLQSDENNPEMYEVTPEEYDHLATSDDVVTQLLFWRSEKKFYAVLAGEAKRKSQSSVILHDAFYKPCSILAFYEIKEPYIPDWNKKYADKSLNRNIMDMEYA